MANHEERYLVIKAFYGQQCACKYKSDALKEKKNLGGEKNGVWVWDRQGYNPCEGQEGEEIK